MQRIKCRFPARLHFGLLDMNGSMGRVDGGIGLAIQHPPTVIEAVTATGIHVPADLDSALRLRLVAGLERVCQHLQMPGVDVRILQRPPAHSGFGSATQILVGAAKTVALLARQSIPAAQLARWAGRGGTSGIGTAAVDGGGFILDGGHTFRRGPDSKQDYAPSSASRTSPPPPVLLQIPFPPEWALLVCLPRGLDISGKQEIALFARECPVPDAQVAIMSRILLTCILPAILERDLETFCTGMEHYQQYGFKAAEIQSQTESVRALMAFLRSQGAQGVGMSSWGPAVFAFGQDLGALQAKVQTWLEQQGGGEVFVTHADNTGHRVLL